MTCRTTCIQRDRVIACDIDEVMGQYLAGYIRFANERLGRAYTFEDFNSYDFIKVQKDLTYVEIQDLVYEYQDSHHFREGYSVLPGAQEGVKQLSCLGDLQLVTARQHSLREITTAWVNKHFGIDGSKIHMANHYDRSASAPRRTKGEICKEINAAVLIDDSLEYALDVASHGIPVVLFDWQGRYGWNKPMNGKSVPENIHRVTDWQEAVSKAEELVKCNCI